MDWSDLTWVESTRKYAVAMTPAVAAVFRGAGANQRARVLRYMKRYAEDGRKNLHDPVFKFQGRLSDGSGSSKKVAVYAFKAWKLRVYGVETSYDGKTVFVCTEIDITKKQDKADQNKLKRAATNFGVLLAKSTGTRRKQ